MIASELPLPLPQPPNHKQYGEKQGKVYGEGRVFLSFYPEIGIEKDEPHLPHNGCREKWEKSVLHESCRIVDEINGSKGKHTAEKDDLHSIFLNLFLVLIDHMEFLAISCHILAEQVPDGVGFGDTDSDPDNTHDSGQKEILQYEPREDDDAGRWDKKIVSESIEKEKNSYFPIQTHMEGSEKQSQIKSRRIKIDARDK